MLTFMKGILKPRREKEADSAPALIPIRLSPDAAAPSIALEPVASPALRLSTFDPALIALGANAGEGQPGSSAGAGPRSNAELVAVLTLGQAGEILSARGDCVPIFGTEPAPMAGRNIARFLQGGLDNDIGRFLQRRSAGANSSETVLLRVIVLRDDGSAFPVSVTSPTWSSDRRLPNGDGGNSPYGWTVAFRGAASPESISLPAAAGKFEPVAKPARVPVEAKPRPAPPVLPPSASTVPSGPAVPASRESKPGRETKRQKDSPAPEPGRAEFELRAQLDAAREAAGYAEAAFKEEALRHQQAAEKFGEQLKREQVERENRFAEELLRLGGERDTLNGQLAAERRSAAELRARHDELEQRVHQASKEMETLQAAAAQRAEEQGRAQAELRAQLEAARESAGYATAALKDEARQKEALEERLQSLSKNLKLEQTEWDQRYAEQLSTLRQERDELRDQLNAGQQAAADVRRRQEELEKQLQTTLAEPESVKTTARRGRTEPTPAELDLRAQLEAAQTAAERAQAAQQEEVARSEALEARLRQLEHGQTAAAQEQRKQFEDEVERLQRERDALHGRLADEERATEEARSRSEALDYQLANDAAEARQTEEARRREQDKRSRAESILRDQLENEKSRKREMETAWSGIVERNLQFEEELTKLRHEQGELSRQLAEQQWAAEETAQRAGELQDALLENKTELERAQAALEEQRAEHERAAAAGSEQLENAQTQCRELLAAQAEDADRQHRVQEELAALRVEQDKLLARTKSEQHGTAEWKRRAEALEQSERRHVTELAGLQNELEELHHARDQAESEWNVEMETAKALSRKLETAWTGAMARNKRLERELAQIRQERDELKAAQGTSALRAAGLSRSSILPGAGTEVFLRGPAEKGTPPALTVSRPKALTPIPAVTNRRATSPSPETAPSRPGFTDGLGQGMPLGVECYNLQP